MQDNFFRVFNLGRVWQNPFTKKAYLHLKYLWHNLNHPRLLPVITANEALGEKMSERKIKLYICSNERKQPFSTISDLADQAY